MGDQRPVSGFVFYSFSSGSPADTGSFGYNYGYNWVQLDQILWRWLDLTQNWSHWFSSLEGSLFLSLALPPPLRFSRLMVLLILAKGVRLLIPLAPCSPNSNLLGSQSQPVPGVDLGVWVHDTAGIPVRFAPVAVCTPWAWELRVSACSVCGGDLLPSHW